MRDQNPAIKAFVDAFAAKSFGISQTEARNKMVCVFCKKPVTKEDFRDTISLREFNISNLCQKCQYETFGVD